MDKFNPNRPAASETSGGLQALRDRYLELTNRVLPQLAKQRQFPVRYNHCFQRIILDNVFGQCWYEALDREKVAYQQLSEAQLEQAIALAEAIIAQPDEFLHRLNLNSLRWRGKHLSSVRHSNS